MGVLKKKEEEELLKSLDGREIIESEASLSWDGRNLLVRIPKDIADYLRLTKDNRLEKNLKFTIVQEGDKRKQTFEIVERTKPKRKNGKKKKK